MGRSCQEAAPGFYVGFVDDFLDLPDELVLAGIVRPCACHGHSSSCDPMTGKCIVRERILFNHSIGEHFQIFPIIPQTN